MALKFQYNKTALQQLRKELRVREKALPTLQAKESALRLEVKKARDEVKAIEQVFLEKNAELERIGRLWPEFPMNLVAVEDIRLDTKKIAGVNTPVFKNASFAVVPFSVLNAPAWIPQGLERLKEAALLQVRIRVAEEKVTILEFARKKTTQKVNLYEKVQIPEYNEAILKIKRFLEDEENLSKSSQKILKARLSKKTEGAA